MTRHFLICQRFVVYTQVMFSINFTFFRERERITAKFSFFFHTLITLFIVTSRLHGGWMILALGSSYISDRMILAVG